jgi:hypothetical protein
LVFFELYPIWLLFQKHLLMRWNLLLPFFIDLSHHMFNMCVLDGPICGKVCTRWVLDHHFAEGNPTMPLATYQTSISSITAQPPSLFGASPHDRCYKPWWHHTNLCLDALFFQHLAKPRRQDGSCSYAPKFFSPLVWIVDSILGVEKNQISFLKLTLWLDVSTFR